MSNFFQAALDPGLHSVMQFPPAANLSPGPGAVGVTPDDDDDEEEEEEPDAWRRWSALLRPPLPWERSAVGMAETVESKAAIKALAETTLLKIIVKRNVDVCSLSKERGG